MWAQGKPTEWWSHLALSTYVRYSDAFSPGNACFTRLPAILAHSFSGFFPNAHHLFVLTSSTASRSPGGQAPVNISMGSLKLHPIPGILLPAVSLTRANTSVGVRNFFYRPVRSKGTLPFLICYGFMGHLTGSTVDLL